MEEQLRMKQHSENNMDGPVNIYLLQETDNMLKMTILSLMSYRKSNRVQVIVSILIYLQSAYVNLGTTPHR